MDCWPVVMWMKRLQRVSANAPGAQAGSRSVVPRIALLLVAPLLGCFEDRIEERLVIGVRGDGVELFYEASYHERHGHGDRAALRVADHERALLDGTNPWLRALNSIPSPLRHGSEAFFDEDRSEGRVELERYTAWAHSRSGLDGGTLALSHVFGHTPISALLTREPGFIEVDLSAGASLGGNRRQRIQMERQLEAWSHSVAVYLGEVADLWRHLEANPNRQRPIYEALFSDLIDPSPEPELTPAEAVRLERLDDAESAVAELFETEDDQSYSLQELSRLIFDPYPLEVVLARLDDGGRVAPIPPDLADGLEDLGDGTWRVRRTSLWDAYLELSGRWVTPNPLATKVAALRYLDIEQDKSPPFDLDSLLENTPRVWDRPTAFEIADQIRSRLAPPEIVRIVWKE